MSHKNRISGINLLLLGMLICDALVSNRAQGVAGEGFPEGNYTPHGYLDNPYHTLWLNFSGMIRSIPPLGFRFREHETVIQLAVSVDGKHFSAPEDFGTTGLHSAYHSKNLFSYNWAIADIRFSATYFLESDQAHGLNCEIKIENVRSVPAQVELRALLSVPPLDFDHYTASAPDSKTVLIRRFAEGPLYLLTTAAGESFAGVFLNSSVFEKFRTEGQREGLKPHEVNVPADFMGGMLALPVNLAPGETKMLRLCLIRDVTLTAGLNKASAAFQNFNSRRAQLLEDDRQFWQSCPRLTGDWPEIWKRGMVYDWETLRMNVRRPIGVFKHHWDAMQVMIPRTVLAETAIDMLAYSYAQPEMAKEVFYGIFADAIAPNVPCLREDGSVNMVSESGEECGTAPSWCLPSLAIRSIYSRTGDWQWAASLYPYLEEFIDWWIANRTHEDGAFFFDNSWESGQDRSARFLVEHRTGGMEIRFFEPVDLHASMVDFTGLMNQFAVLLEKDEDKWRNVHRQYLTILNNRYWKNGEFQDIDRRTGKHSTEGGAILLFPYTLDLTNTRQNQAFRKKYQDMSRLSDWTNSATRFQIVLEALWNTGDYRQQAELIHKQLNYVYGWWDRRHWETPDALPRVWGHVDRPANLLEYHPRTWDRGVGQIDESTNRDAPPREYGLPMPGVASENWRSRDGDQPGGMENYGWGAVLPMHLIRGIIGYRELPSFEENGFLLVPAIPSDLLNPGNNLGMASLHYKDIIFDVNYKIQPDGKILVTFSWNSETEVQPGISVNGHTVAAVKTAGRTGNLQFTVPNFTVCRVLLN